MGLRVQKNLGYFIFDKKAKNIFVNNYQEILSAFEDNDLEQQQQFLSVLDDIIHQYKEKDPFSINTVELISLKEYIISEASANNRLSFISSIYKYDDYHGVLFSTPEMIKAGRRDNLLDYYDQKNAAFELKKLNQPIFPVSGFIYNGGLEKYGLKSLTVGQTYTSNITTYAAIINHLVYKDKFKIKNNSLNLLRKQNFFHPESYDFFYDIAKAVGLLKPNITLAQFKQSLEPVIITSWS